VRMGTDSVFRATGPAETDGDLYAKNGCLSPVFYTAW
jgi:hypothetical protein